MLVFMQSILEGSCIFYCNRLYKTWNILQIFEKTIRSVKRICFCEVAVNWQCKIPAASSCWITNVTDYFPSLSIVFTATSRVSMHSFPNNFYPVLSWPFSISTTKAMHHFQSAIKKVDYRKSEIKLFPLFQFRDL